MRVLTVLLTGVLLLLLQRVPLCEEVPKKSKPAPTQSPPTPAPAPVTRALGQGAAPGNADGPGGFVPRGAMRHFYAGAGGRLWYYMNNYYWAPPTAPLEGLWLKTVVVEEFKDLRRWPAGKAVKGPVPKVTVEYWEVGPKRRTVWVDNHKDYCLLSDRYTAGAIVVEATLTLGRLQVKGEKGTWRPPGPPYVLESRNYRGGGGVGADRTRFVALRTEAETVWTYRVPWSTHPQRLTRSNWKRLKLPTWKLMKRRAPPRLSAPVTTHSAR